MRPTIILAFLIATLAPPAAAVQYVIAPGKGNEVVFWSEAPLESFEGKTDQARGSVSLDWSDPAGTLEIRAAVDLASLDTGINLRNHHMRENHLHTEEFPEAIFAADSITGLSVGEGPPASRIECFVTGDFTLHGVTRAMTVPVTIVAREAGALEIEARFDVILSDYGIPRPKFLFLKLDETQRVRVRLVATPEARTK
ncbi:MAG: YceI family protein [Candidatus Eisenbacteria bacterium]